MPLAVTEPGLFNNDINVLRLKNVFFDYGRNITYVRLKIKLKSDKSQHILNASSNLLGICFIVLTSLKLLKLNSSTFIDECTAITMISLMVSCIFSFLSLRSVTKRSMHYEKIADGVFLVSLLLMFLTTMLITFDII